MIIGQITMNIINRRPHRMPRLRRRPLSPKEPKKFTLPILRKKPHLQCRPCLLAIVPLEGGVALVANTPFWMIGRVDAERGGFGGGIPVRVYSTTATATGARAG